MDTALITYSDGTLHTCTLTDTASITVTMNSSTQTLDITAINGDHNSVDLSTVESIAFSQTVTTDSPSDTVASDTTSTDSSEEPVDTTEPTTDTAAPETTEEPANETVAPTEVDVTNGEEIVINETDAPVVTPEVAVE